MPEKPPVRQFAFDELFYYLRHRDSGRFSTDGMKLLWLQSQIQDSGYITVMFDEYISTLERENINSWAAATFGDFCCGIELGDKSMWFFNRESDVSVFSLRWSEFRPYVSKPPDRLRP